MIIVTGPAGCGKTCTLYACLSHITAFSPSLKVMTVEDPVECLLPGTTQVPVRADANLTFIAALRAVLRSDPDVIMVGEIRDLETLALAQQTALNGHRVLITLHTSEAVTALQRMVDVGASRLTVADSTKLVIAQRLARLLCRKCSKRRPPERHHVALARKLARISRLDWDSLPTDFRQPSGCPDCHMTGFRGRTVIAEALELTPRLSAALIRGAAAADLRAIAVAEGMTTIAADGIRRAATGVTSLAEVMRLLSPVYCRELDG